MLKYKFVFSVMLISVLFSGCKKQDTDVVDPAGTNTMILNNTVSDGWCIPLYKGLDEGITGPSPYPYVFVRCGIYDADLNFVFWVKQGADLTFTPWGGNIVGQGGEMVNMGKVSGLGALVTKPTSGWSDKSAVEVGNGYILRFKHSFNYSDPNLQLYYYRMYVVEWLRSTNGGIIGAKVKYQGPF